MKGNGYKLQDGRFTPDIRKNFFMEIVAKHWNRLQGEVVEPPSLEIFNKHVDVVLSDMDSDGLGNVRPTFGLSELKGLLQPQ